MSCADGPRRWSASYHFDVIDGADPAAHRARVAAVGELEVPVRLSQGPIKVSAFHSGQPPPEQHVPALLEGGIRDIHLNVVADGEVDEAIGFDVRAGTDP